MEPTRIARATGEALSAALPADYTAVLLLTAAGPWCAWSAGDGDAPTAQPGPLAPVAAPPQARVTPALLLVPVVADGPTWGMLALHRLAERAPFGEADARVARDLAVLAAAALSRDVPPAPADGARAQIESYRALLEKLVQRVRSMERLAAAGCVAADLAHQLRKADLGAAVSAARKGDAEGALRTLDAAARRVRKMEVFAHELDALVGEADAIEVGRLFSLALRLCGEEARRSVAQEADEGLVRGDPGDLAVALAHLVANAVEAVGELGSVALEGRRAGDRFVLTVADDGPGLPPQAGQPLFSTRGRAGVGLYTARALVERHGGTLELESAPGAGTIATLTLPVAG
ncbi:MAG: sensor histidine kinase [Myxococcota bacterium]